MRISLVTKLVVHDLRPLGPGRQSDRRGPICDLVLADVPNAEHAIDVATRTLQRVCSLLDDSYFWSDSRDKGPSGFTEQFESWIDPGPDGLEGKAVRIRHKYWDEDKIGAFLDIMLSLALLHGWEVDDRRTVGPSVEEESLRADQEEEEFLDAVARLRKGDNPHEVAEGYAESAYHMDTCPWRLLVLDLAGICYCDCCGSSSVVRDAGQAGAHVAMGSEPAGTGKVLPFRKRDG